MDRQDVKFSIRKKILGVTLVAALPFLAISIYLLISMSNYNHTYNKIVQNLTIANNYNLDFKDEMVYNICENAIKYNKEGGEIRVWVGNTLNGKKIIVTDTGIGIPKEQQERIFERFYRVDKSHSKEIGGTGLGLSIVKHGAILHNAKIHVDSELGKGTRMELTF